MPRRLLGPGAYIHYALHYVSPRKLVIKILKRYQKSVMDCVATLSSRHKKLASIICVKLLTLPQGIDTLIQHMRGMVFP